MSYVDLGLLLACTFVVFSFKTLIYDGRLDIMKNVWIDRIDDGKDNPGGMILDMREILSE